MPLKQPGIVAEPVQGQSKDNRGNQKFRQIYPHVDAIAVAIRPTGIRRSVVFSRTTKVGADVLR